MSEGPLVTPTEGPSEITADADRALRARMCRTPHPFFGGADALARQPENTETNRLPQYADILDELQAVNPDDPLAASWHVDPYERDPEMTVHYVECFFSSVNDSLHHIFPHARFILWMKSCRTKSAEDKMLLYSMMALASLFSDRPDRVVALRRYSRIARFAIQKSQHTLSLQLAQSHLIMGLWYYAIGSLVGSWDSIGAAGRVVSGLQYNVESWGVIVDQNQVCEYGLHPQALMECRRRTFWVSFILDVSVCKPGFGQIVTYADTCPAIFDFLLGIVCIHLIGICVDTSPMSGRDIRGTAIRNGTLLSRHLQPDPNVH